jgi:RHS repeat-associated protein
MVRIEPSAVSLLLAPDDKGSVLGEQRPEQRLRIGYSPYGSLRAQGSPQSRTGFNGQFREPQGWYHLGNGHRVYNPALRRFHGVDELSPFAEGGLNAYAYCLGDPVNHVDPTGRSVNFMQIATLVGMAVGIAAGGASLFGPMLIKAGKSKAAGMVASGVFTQPRLASLASGMFGPSGRIARYAGTNPPIGVVSPGGLDAFATQLGMVVLVPPSVSAVDNIAHEPHMSTELTVAASALGLFVGPIKLAASFTPVLPASKAGLRFSRLMHGRAKVAAAQKKASLEKMAKEGPPFASLSSMPALPPGESAASIRQGDFVFQQMTDEIFI